MTTMCGRFHCTLPGDSSPSEGGPLGAIERSGEHEGVARSLMGLAEAAARCRIATSHDGAPVDS